MVSLERWLLFKVEGDRNDFLQSTSVGSPARNGDGSPSPGGASSREVGGSSKEVAGSSFRSLDGTSSSDARSRERWRSMARRGSAAEGKDGDYVITIYASGRKA